MIQNVQGYFSGHRYLRLQYTFTLVCEESFGLRETLNLDMECHNQWSRVIYMLL